MTERERERERDSLHDELFSGWDGALSGTAGQRKLEGNQKETPLYRDAICQSPTAQETENNCIPPRERRAFHRQRGVYIKGRPRAFPRGWRSQSSCASCAIAE